MNIQYVNNMSDENIELVLLGFLINKPKHGYEIFKEVSNPNGIGNVYRIKIGKMYSILKKFEEKDYIFSKTIHEGKRPPKNLFNLTKKGEIAFESWMVNPITHGRDFRILFLLKLFFIKSSKKINGLTLISSQKIECEEWAKRIKLLIINENGITEYQRIVKQYRLSQVEGYINWLDWCERTVNEKNNI
jgi:PadR family transcriptional regulator, regulatory protein AphA